MNSSITSLSPTPKNGKHGWYEQFRKHNLLLNKSKAKLLIIGDSLVPNLSRYPEIWRKYFNLHFSSDLHLKYIFILCGTNNIDRNSPLFLAPSFPLVWSFKRRVTNFKLLLYHFYRAIINTQEDEELSTLAEVSMFK